MLNGFLYFVVLLTLQRDHGGGGASKLNVATHCYGSMPQDHSFGETAIIQRKTSDA
jgi:hypothetical protein